MKVLIWFWAALRAASLETVEKTLRALCRHKTISKSIAHGVITSSRGRVYHTAALDRGVSIFEGMCGAQLDAGGEITGEVWMAKVVLRGFSRGSSATSVTGGCLVPASETPLALVNVGSRDTPLRTPPPTRSNPHCSIVQDFFDAIECFE